MGPEASFWEDRGAESGVFCSFDDGDVWIDECPTLPDLGRAAAEGSPRPAKNAASSGSLATGSSGVSAVAASTGGATGAAVTGRATTGVAPDEVLAATGLAMGAITRAATGAARLGGAGASVRPVKMPE